MQLEPAVQQPTSYTQGHIAQPNSLYTMYSALLTPKRCEGECNMLNLTSCTSIVSLQCTLERQYGSHIDTTIQLASARCFVDFALYVVNFGLSPCTTAVVSSNTGHTVQHESSVATACLYVYGGTYPAISDEVYVFSYCSQATVAL